MIMYWLFFKHQAYNSVNYRLRNYLFTKYITIQFIHFGGHLEFAGSHLENGKQKSMANEKILTSTSMV